jgi:glycosyltransferase involved in cell wall biosynthesis
MQGFINFNLKKQKIDISVVVSNYNNGSFLIEFLESILRSTVIPGEMIIIDDGSTDYSVDIMSSYLHHDFIRLITSESNQGLAHALNKGIEISAGKYIARIDPDDIVLPDRFERQFRYLEENPGIDVIGGNVVYFNNKTGNEITKSNFALDHQDIYRAYRRGDHGVQHPTVMVRSEVYKKYRYNQEVYPAEDYDLFARMIRDGYRFANLSEPLNRMRVHPASISDSISYATVEQTFVLRDEIFGGNTAKCRKKAYYGYILHYRRFLSSTTPIARILHITVASLNMPGKALKRIILLFTKSNLFSKNTASSTKKIRGR